MALKENLKRRRKALHLTLDQVSAVVGVSRQTIQKYESGVIANIPPDKVELLAQALDTTPAELMGWQQPTLNPLTLEGVLPVRRRQVPMLGEIAAGQPIFAYENHDSYVLCEDDMPCDFALQVKGDSMMPRLLDGDIVFVRQQSDVLDGQIAAVLVEDSATLKHVYHFTGGEGIQLVADNPHYPPMIYSGSDASQVRILGLAVGYHRSLL